MILDISRTLFSLYVYIVKYFCPSHIIGVNDKITNSPLVSQYNVKTNEPDEPDETYDTYVDEIDEIDEIDINEMINTENEKYNEKYKKNYKQFLQNSQTNNSPIKKSYSASTTVHYCGWCSKYIDTPSHFYMDRVYCNHTCRKYQIMKDDRMSLTRRQTAVSFSV